MDQLHKMADALIKYETIDADQIKDIMEGKDPRPPKDWDDNESNSDAGGSSVGVEKDSTEGGIGGPVGQH